MPGIQTPEELESLRIIARSMESHEDRRIRIEREKQVQQAMRELVAAQSRQLQEDMQALVESWENEGGNGHTRGSEIDLTDAEWVR